MRHFFRAGELLPNLKTICIYSALLSILCLVSMFSLSAQTPRKDSGANGSLAVKPLQVGDTVPALIWKSKFPALNTSTGHKTIALKEYANKKLLILDFWATWCAPCIASLPKMDSLQLTYSKDIAIIPITYETANKVSSFFEMRNRAQVMPSNLDYITDNTLFSNLFKHSTIPHYIWLDGKGRVLAITDAKQINADNIEKMIRGQEISLPIKNDYRPPYDKTKPVFFDPEKIWNTNFIKQSTLTEYSDRFGCGYTYTVGLHDDHPQVKDVAYRRVFAHNLSMIQLYQLAHSDHNRYFNWHNTIVLSKDSLAINSRKQGAGYISWLQADRGFCYELVVANKYQNQAWSMMRNDLRQHFPDYRAYTEKRKVPSYCLVRTSDVDKIKSQGGDKINTISPYGGRINQYPLSLLISVLEDRVFVPLKKPLVNLTDYRGLIDITINAKLTDLKALNRELAKYDLAIVAQERDVEVLIIADEVSTK
ncbi:TlpA disulfide reductase family protein [Sphingobacterium ginsenosidimutans]